jgi:hypothetical protein
MLVVLSNIIFVVLRLIEYDTLAAANRVRELEKIINSYAGKTLLKWETERGLYVIGYPERGKYIAQGYADLGRPLIRVTMTAVTRIHTGIARTLELARSIGNYISKIREIAKTKLKSRK